MLDERTHRQSNEFTVQFFQTFELEISAQLLCGCLRGAVRTAPTISTGSKCRHLFVVGVFVKSWVKCIHVMNVDMRNPLICTRQHAISTSFLALCQRNETYFLKKTCKPEFFTVRFFWSMAGPMALTITTGLHSCRVLASQLHTSTRAWTALGNLKKICGPGGPSHDCQV